MRIFILIFFLVFELFALNISDNNLYIFEGSSRGVIETSIDPDDCFVDISNNIGKIKHDCKIKKVPKYGKLLCSKDYKYCVVKSHVPNLIIKSMNKYGSWSICNVRSDDTLNLRAGVGSKYKKVGELPYNARGIKVLSIKKNSKRSWYFINYKGLKGWVNSRYLKYLTR